MKPPYAIGLVPSLSGHAVAYRWRSLPRVRRHRASKPQGSSERVLPWQITMDQLIFASLSHTHYWYEVGMLKVVKKTHCNVHMYMRPGGFAMCKRYKSDKRRRWWRSGKAIPESLQQPREVYTHSRKENDTVVSTAVRVGELYWSVVIGTNQSSTRPLTTWQHTQAPKRAVDASIDKTE